MIRLLKIILLIFFITSCTERGSVLHDTKGNQIDVSSLKGKWVIINYWAAWCQTCIKEIPELNNFYQHNQDKNIVLYGVNYDRMPMNELQLAINKTHIAFPVVLEDPAQTWTLYGIDFLPVTFTIIDPNGKVAKKIVGASTEQSLLAAIHQFVAMKKNFYVVWIIIALMLSGLLGFFISLYQHNHDAIPRPEGVNGDVQLIETFHYPSTFVKQLQGDPRAGEKIFKQFCTSCRNNPPIIDVKAPRINDKKAWEIRRQMGMDTLMKLTTTGVGAMPARGGCFECSDEQLRETILYILKQSYP